MKHFLNYALIFITIQLSILWNVSGVENGSCAVTQCEVQSKVTMYFSRGNVKPCRCDSECSTYDDCCIDSQYKSAIRKASDFDCVNIKYRPSGIYIKRSCSVNNYRLSGYLLRRYCRSSLDYDAQISNYTLKLPVTTKDGVTYGNRFCAICDNKQNFTTWNAHFSCESHLVEVNMTGNLTNYVYNDTLQKWTYVDGNTTETCLFAMIPPPKLRSQLRKCRANMVKSCPLPRLPRNILYTPKCNDYTSIVQHVNGTYYKNEYCALCNNVSSAELKCTRNSTAIDMTMPTLVSLITTTPITVSSTSSIRSTTSTTSRSTSASTTSRPYSTSTQSPWSSSLPASPSNADTNITTEVREFLQILVNKNCEDLLSSLSLTKLVVETRSFKTMKRTYIKDSYLVSAFPKRVCKEYPSEKSAESSEEPIATVGFFVNFGAVVSIFYTLWHLYDFQFSTATPTATQKSFASYCIVLVIYNVSFLASNHLGGFCRLIGPVNYFAFLVSVFWLSVLSFDISCKIWCCVQGSEVFAQIRADNSEKFKRYSLVSWIIPAVILIIMIYEADIYSEFIASGTIYPTCWLPESQTFVIFFLLPLTIAISIDFAFWLFSASVVRIQSAVVAKLFSQHGIDFRFHTGLIITSNLMWSTALIGMYYENSFLWLCYSGLNATLGLLVYLCSPVKRASAIRISAYLNERFLPVDENQIDK